MKRLLGACALLCLWCHAAFAAVTGSQLTAQLLTALDLPLSKPLTSDADALAEGARLGIFSDADNWVDGPLTKGLGLNLAFRSLGLDIELDIADLLLENPNRFSQRRLESVSLLASTIKPEVPSSLLEDTDALMTEADLSALLGWVARAKAGLVWDQKIETDAGILWLHRQGLGRPPKSWRVSLASFASPAEAESAKSRYASAPFEVQLFQLEEYTHLASPALASAAEAKKLSAKFDGSIVIEGDSAPSEALFFVAWSPNESHEGWLLSARQVGKKSLPLSKYWGYSNAVVALNGGYFGGGKPIGTLIMNGLPQYLPYTGRTLVGWKGTHTAFGLPDFRIVMTDSSTRAVARDINNPPPPGEASFYAPPLGAAPNLSDALVQSYTSDASGRSVKWWAATKGPALPEPADANFELQWGAPELEGINWGLQGGPLLLKDGVVQTKNEGVARGVTHNRHPRTLVGVKEGRQWWIVVDGRNSWHSRGMTLAEATSWAQQDGFSDLLNLDGGGSSEFIYQGRIINNPSDGRERALPYAVMFGGELRDENAPLSDPLQSLFDSLP